MKALVIGASGQVGALLLSSLEQAGVEAVGTGHSRAGRFAPLDIMDAKATAEAVAAAEPDLVFLAVNNAGGVDYCEEYPEQARALNVEGTRHVAEACRKIKAKLVYFSTDYVFDGKQGPYDEEAEPNPVSVYGRAKLDAEKIVAAVPKSLILRTTAVYGWDRGSKNFAMQVWDNLSSGRRMRAPSDQWCTPTLGDYLAEASVRLAQSGASGVYNVSGKDWVTRAELAKSLAGAFALDTGMVEAVPTAALGQKAARPEKGGLKTGKLARALGTDPWDMKEQLARLRRKWRGDTHQKGGVSAVTGPAAALKAEILEKVREYHALVNPPKRFEKRKSRVPYAGRVYGADEMTALVDSSLDFWLTLGPWGERFERKMRDFFGARDFACVNSGSTANLTAVMALMSKQLERPWKAGDEIITPAVTFPTTLAPLVHGGIVPVLVDCELGTYNVDPKEVERAITKKTRGLMIPHTLGNPCALDTLVALAQKHDLYLIEDTCDALGAKYDGKLAGTFGELGTLSFYPAHHITMGEGGGVIVNKGRLSRIVRSVRDWGRDCWCAPGESNTCGRRFGWKLGDLPVGYDHKYTYSNLGYNFKPTDMQAAVGTIQADRIPDFVARRNKNFARLYKGLKRYEDRLVLPKWEKKADPSWFAFPLTVKKVVTRAALVHHLETANIETRELFGGNILRQPGYKGIKARVVGKLPNSDRVMRDTFFIGVYPGLSDEMLDFVIEAFDEFFRNQR